MTSGIYAIFNIANDKCYIGQAFKFKKRWTNHRVELSLSRHVNIYLQAAWNKYGSPNFIFVILERVSDTANLTSREQYWMDALKSADREFGYNMAPAAGSLIGFKASDETKAKLSALRKGKPRSEEVKAKIRAGSKGRVHSPEARAKMAEAKKGSKFSEETKLKMSESQKGNTHNLGRKQSVEEIEVRRKANTGKKRSPEFCAALSERNRGRIVSAETRERMRIAALNRKVKNQD